MLKLNKQFRMTRKEIDALKTLREEKPNLPNVKMTIRDIKLIDDLYYKYISKNIDYKAWDKPLYKMEQEQKWLGSNSRVTTIQAKRMIVESLLEKNKHLKTITDKEASRMFLNHLKGTRQSRQHLLHFAYWNK